MGLWETVSGLPVEIANALLNTFKNTAMAFIQPQLDVAKALITYNINPNDFSTQWLAIVGVISAFYPYCS